MKQTSHSQAARLPTVWVFFLTVLVTAPARAANLYSRNVAYVWDDSLFPCGANGCGMNDSTNPFPGYPGASIFSNAILAHPPGTGDTASYTTADGTLTVKLTNVPVSSIIGNPAAISAFDTAILYETCQIGTPQDAPALKAVNDFLVAGNKVMIFDGDGCGDFGLGAADWGGFVFPFSTNSPGPRGRSGDYVFVEPSSLTAGLSVGQQPGDSVGDANVFTNYDGSWFRAISGDNINMTGIVMAYARTPTGGLALYEGEDFWFAYSQNIAHDRLLFDNMLMQQWNPDQLPNTAAASGITLTSDTQMLSYGQSARFTVAVADAAGNPIAGVEVALLGISGPDKGLDYLDVSDSNGSATFGVRDTSTAGGTDVMEAFFLSSDGIGHTTNQVQLVLRPALSPPDFPRNLRVAPGNGFAMVSWDPPASDGGSPIISYTVVASSGPTVTVLPSQLAVNIGLTADCFTQVRFGVFATNAIGEGPAAASSYVRPSGFLSSDPPQVVFILADGAPSKEDGGTYYPIPVTNPDTGVAVVTSYCPTDLNGQMASFPAGLHDNLWRWDSFPVQGPSSLSPPSTGDVCLSATGHCLTSPFAAEGAVFLPYSYRGAGFVGDSTGVLREFQVESYNGDDSSRGDPAQQVAYLHQEIASVHTAWPSTKIVLIGHSYGGLLIEQYWENYWLTSGDHQGVIAMFSLDSPINGLQDTRAAFVVYGNRIVDLWKKLWHTKQERDRKLLAWDADGSFTPVGIADDETYVPFDPPGESIASQVLVQCQNGGSGLGCGLVSPPDLVPACSAQRDNIDGITGHDVVKACAEVIDAIKRRVN